MPLKRKSKVAVVSARGLGDGLLFLILANNLKRSGHEVTFYSTALCQMRDWFPEHTILPFDQADFSAMDHVFAQDHSSLSKEDEKTTILFEHNFDRTKCMVENLVHFSKNLGLSDSSDTGLVIPAGFTHKKHPERIVLHPMSTSEKKNWHPKKFRNLAKKLEKMGFAPVFCVSPNEKALWPEAHAFEEISGLAQFIYESGALIGNDSGLGHLASLLHIPTLSLFARKSYSRLWRPGWGPGSVVTPKIPLIGAPMKQHYWKNLLTTRQVIKNFKDLVKD